jgi:tRNA G18 (ribose-2'-O)-methylase SpoU
MRGYFGIGVYHPKTEQNIGTLWRSATLYGASFIFTVGRRYEKQASDTTQSWRHIPLWHFFDWDELREHIPYDCPLVCVELSDNAFDLRTFIHPERAIYLLGAEDHGVPEHILAGRPTVQIPCPQPYSMNVAVAGSLVMYDRFVKGAT